MYYYSEIMVVIGCIPFKWEEMVVDVKKVKEVKEAVGGLYTQAIQLVQVVQRWQI